MTIDFETSTGSPTCSWAAGMDEVSIPAASIGFLLLALLLINVSLPNVNQDIVPPTSIHVQPVTTGDALHVNAQGELQFRSARGVGAIQAILNTTTTPRVLASNELDASVLATVLSDLRQAGASSVTILVAPE